MHKLVLKPGREKSLKRRHPWVFSGAVARIDGQPQSGEAVEVTSSDGAFLALAAYSAHSQIRARVWSFTACDIDDAFIRARVTTAVEARSALAIERVSDACRLIHAEADGLPGVVVDRYRDTAVMQILSAGAERWRHAIADALVDCAGVTRVWERSDADVRELEGLAARSGLMRGPPISGALTIHEHDIVFRVEVDAGHKTGFYLDQRDNRLTLRTLVRGKSVLDCFSYTGAFALNAVKGGASDVTAIESSALAIDAARRNAAENAVAGVDWIEGDVFQTLRRMRDQGRRFDVVVLDPPKLAPTAAHAERASRAYKDVNLLAFKLLNAGGYLMTYSCSGGISPDLFQKIVAGAALDAGVDARIERWLHAAADHPVSIHFPESEYLKGLLLKVIR